MKFPIKMSFELTENFIDKYKKVKPNFGFDGLGEFVYMRTYSRIKEDGTNERWWETVRRVVEGIYAIQKQHVVDYNLGWNPQKAQHSAQEMYDRIFSLKMIGSGRALWAMGTPTVMEKGLIEALFNCSYRSTGDGEFSDVIANLMDWLMLGAGVGTDLEFFKTEKIVKSPSEKVEVYEIPDTREGWVEATRLLIQSYYGGKNYSFDYSLIRPEGEDIKGFGGIASGSAPLIKMHEKMSDVLSKKIDSHLNKKDIADIVNFIGVCVVSGNVRRSAQLIGSELDDEFLNLKNYKINPERASHGWASNNSVIAKVGMDYSEIAKRIKDNAEPGLLWLENGQNYGRMRDTEKNYKDARVGLTNPCFSGKTKILTPEGYVEIGRMAGKKTMLVDASGGHQLGEIFSTGIKAVVELKFSTKKIITCTPDHRFKTNDGRTMTALEMKGLTPRPALLNDYKNLNDEYILYGFIQGDGALGRLKSPDHLGVEVNIGGKDGDIYNLLCGHTYTKSKRKVYLQDVKNTLLSLKFSSKTLPTRVFPKTYISWKKKNKASFLQGCFSANGSVNNAGRITYKATSKKFISQLKTTLNDDFGIDSYITTNKAKKNKFSNGTYLVKESYDLNIGRYDEKLKFHNRINFYHKYKRKLLEKVLLEKAPRIISVSPAGQEEVFDFSLPDVHWGIVDGVVAHNCGEIFLESGEMCNLSSINPSNHEDLEDFKKTIKYAFLFAKTITLLSGSWVESNRVMLRNRRIGLDFGGVTQFAEKNGLLTLKEWMETGYDTAKYYDEVYSNWFAVPQSIKLTTIKPNGTTSLLGGVTAGVHYPQANYYIRRVRLATNSPFLKSLKKAGYKVEKAKEDPEKTLVVEFPVRLRDEMRTVDDVSMWEQLKITEFAQKYWADNAVSSTITFSPEEGDSLESLLNHAQFVTKGLSFLPKTDGGAYEQMPYESITKELYEKMAKKIKPLDFSNMDASPAVGEKYCETDVCEIRTENENIELSLEELI